jgi:hypothetical protein
MATNVYQLVISGVAGGQFFSNIRHFSFDDSGYGTTELAAAALIAAWDAANRTKLRNLLSSGVTLKSYKARCVTAPGGFEAFSPITILTTGTRAGNPSVSGIGLCLKGYALNVTKRIGKMFLPAVSELDCIDGEFTSSFMAAFAANANFLNSPITLTGGGAPVATPVIFHRGPPHSWVTLTQVDMCTYAATQRRRQLPV